MTNPLVGHVIGSQGHVSQCHVIPMGWACHVIWHVTDHIFGHMIGQVILSQGHVLEVQLIPCDYNLV